MPREPCYFRAICDVVYGIVVRADRFFVYAVGLAGSRRLPNHGSQHPKTKLGQLPDTKNYLNISELRKLGPGTTWPRNTFRIWQTWSRSVCLIFPPSSNSQASSKRSRSLAALSLDLRRFDSAAGASSQSDGRKVRKTAKLTSQAQTLNPDDYLTKMHSSTGMPQA